jgi:two-component system, NarL family, response regulator DegU
MEIFYSHIDKNKRMKYTAIVADDHPIFRKGLMDILKNVSFLEIVSEVSDGLEAYQKILALRPHLAILDIEMPGLSGLDVCRKILNEKSETKFIVLTMHKEKDFFNDAMKIGVMGYVLKDHAITELILCVEQVLKGKKFVSPDIEKFLVQSGTKESVPGLENLTSTEKVILKLVAESKTSSEIAGLLFISANTVDNHRANMVKKLGLEGKNSLLRFALQHNHLL